MTYFVQASFTKHIKIGRASDPALRLKDLQIGCPEQLILLGCVDANELSETEAHDRFNQYHERGEWFWPGPLLEQYIQDRFSIPNVSAGYSPVNGCDSYSVDKDRKYFTFADPELCLVSPECLKAALSGGQIKADQPEAERQVQTRLAQIAKAALIALASGSRIKSPREAAAD